MLPLLLAWVALPSRGRPGNPGGALVAALAIASSRRRGGRILRSLWLWERLSPIGPPLPANTTIREGTIFSWGALSVHPLRLFGRLLVRAPLMDLHLDSPMRVALPYWPMLLPAACCSGGLSLARAAARSIRDRRD